MVIMCPFLSLRLQDVAGFDCTSPYPIVQTAFWRFRLWCRQSLCATSNQLSVRLDLDKPCAVGQVSISRRWWRRRKWLSDQTQIYFTGPCRGSPAGRTGTCGDGVPALGQVTGTKAPDEQRAASTQGDYRLQQAE